jgi:tRNA(fMet)-specific endonuclease VapC
MDQALLDTDILSEVLKQKDHQVLTMARHCLAQHQRFAFSAMTVYEIVRGMQANRATRQVTEFLKMVGTSDVFPVSVPVLMRTADLWAEGHNHGHPHDDADLIIAATAREAQRVLVTGNTSHFSWIAGLRLPDWRALAP